MNVSPVYERISSAYEALSSFRDRLAEISANEFSSENPRLFIELLIKLVDTLDTRLFWDYAEQARKLASERQTQESIDSIQGLERKVSSTLRAISGLSWVVQYIDEAKSHLAPWGVISQFERLSRCVVDNSRVIVSPTWDYNYIYYPIDHHIKLILSNLNLLDQDLYQALNSILKKYPRFFGLSYPSIQVDNVLQLTAWAHELGHFVDNRLGEEATGNSRSFISEELIRDKLRIQLSNEEWDHLTQLFSQQGVSETNVAPIDKFEVRRLIIRAFVNILRRWAREIFADFFSVRVFGPASLFGFCDLALFLYPDLDISGDDDHPPIGLRLRLMLEEIKIWSSKREGNGNNSHWADNLPSDEQTAIRASLDAISKRIAGQTSRSNRGASQQEDEKKVATFVITDILDRLVYNVASIVRGRIDEYIKKTTHSSQSCYLCPEDFDQLAEQINLLKSYIPPNPQNIQNDKEFNANVQLGLRLNTGWFHWIAQREYPEKASERHFHELKSDRIGIERLIKKSIELLEAEQWYKLHQKIDVNTKSQTMRSQSANQHSVTQDIVTGGVLGRDELLRRINSRSNDESLVITPVLDIDQQVDEASVDVRLGNEFIATKHTRLHSLDPANQGIGMQIAEYQTKYYVPFGHSYVLHPMQFVLGCTLEYISLPKDLTSLVVGRSSWGRLGLIIATASKVDPGFKGVLTLELVNLGNVPIFLYPCTRIAQLVFYHVY